MLGVLWRGEGGGGEGGVGGGESGVGGWGWRSGAMEGVGGGWVGFSLVALGSPSPGEVAGGVHVGVGDMSTAATAERGAATVPRFDVAAFGAGL